MRSWISQGADRLGLSVSFRIYYLENANSDTTVQPVTANDALCNCLHYVQAWLQYYLQYVDPLTASLNAKTNPQLNLSRHFRVLLTTRTQVMLCLCDTQTYWAFMVQYLLLNIILPIWYFHIPALLPWCDDQ